VKITIIVKTKIFFSFLCSYVAGSWQLTTAVTPRTHPYPLQLQVIVVKVRKDHEHKSTLTQSVSATWSAGDTSI